MTTDLYFRIERLEEENRALLKENAKLEGIIQGKDEFLKDTLERASEMVLSSWSNPKYVCRLPYDALDMLSCDILKINNKSDDEIVK